MKEQIIFQTAFARYTSESILGEGGAGRVYKVYDESGGEFAIKVLHPDKATREKRKRFKNEVGFCQKNCHPNILTVIDHGVLIEDGKEAPFCVMPLYQSSLRKLISAGIEPSRILYYFSQLLDGVEAAHLQKVVHRDLKPENVLHDRPTDRLVIVDFGVAHFAEDELATLVETTPSTRLANFQYAAPEQRRPGLPVDCRADIYALGLMLNEMFTGEVPSGTSYKIIAGVATDYGYLDDLVSRMLRQSPGERPASIEEIKGELIGRKNEFVTRQRLADLENRVIPTTDVDDPLILDPPRLVNVDYERGMLTLFLQRPVNSKWVWALQNMGGHTSLMGKGPERFSISGDKASISSEEGDVQRIIDYFKQWLPRANRVYEERIRSEIREAEKKERERLQWETEESERRLRVLRNVKL